jgi:steroid 5-alpha reductase family enzyme
MSSTSVPSDWFQKLVKLAPEMEQTSAFRVTGAVVVGMYEVSNAPTSNWAPQTNTFDVVWPTYVGVVAEFVLLVNAK